eukprot:TRINITY_DN255_c0_g2_i2.p1 TRINITY_DN255_c0_g2~~TRINITY_DN255_c0_g2_i2.p1  ORF type:complete len:226 (+),score=28.45 TRINITY_DN255_c0_g2_i2:74-751(+)
MKRSTIICISIVALLILVVAIEAKEKKQQQQQKGNNNKDSSKNNKKSEAQLKKEKQKKRQEKEARKREEEKQRILQMLDEARKMDGISFLPFLPSIHPPPLYSPPSLPFPFHSHPLFLPSSFHFHFFFLFFLPTPPFSFPFRSTLCHPVVPCTLSSFLAGSLFFWFYPHLPLLSVLVSQNLSRTTPFWTSRPMQAARKSRRLSTVSLASTIPMSTPPRRALKSTR